MRKVTNNKTPGMIRDCTVYIFRKKMNAPD